MKTEQEMYDLILKISAADERIRAVYMHGSRANPNAKKDKYSDYDIVFVVTEIDSFVEDKNWINVFGGIAFVFEGLKNENIFFEKEINDLSRFYCWCMLFKDGSRLDLLAEIKDEAMKSKFTANKRTVVLLDKDDCLPKNTPTKEKYAACCAGFWWFLNDVAKAIARGQLPTAKEIFESTIKETLNQMIDWHRTVLTVPDDYTNFWHTIFAACELFSKTASEVAEQYGFTYDSQGEKNMLNYLTKVRDGKL
jgi:aminoglycoside 6-adenylyltransferase